MAKRAMIRIDESKCNGCGLCVPSCAEGALQIVDGKARLTSDRHCDGLGACLGECPQGALTVEEREADEFDLQGAMEHVHSHKPSACACPGSAPTVVAGAGGSQLAQWPVQFHLVSANAPYFRNADLLVTADCVPFAMADYHQRYLAGRAVIVGCPKLDETATYVGKLSQIIQQNDLASLTVLIMEVPCCGGMLQIVRSAVAMSGVDIPIREVVVSRQGEVIRES